MDQQREDALLDAALEILSEVGFERLTVVGVCERAGASTKTAYRRWANKDELLAAALRRAVLRETESSADIVYSGVLRDDFIAFLLDIFGSFRSSSNLVVGLIVAARTPGALGEVAKAIAVDHQSLAVRAILDRAEQTGSVASSVDPARVSALLRGYFLNAVLVNEESPTRAEIEHFVDEIVMPFITAPVTQARLLNG
ncbi:MAG: TetR/AcrR family transcriptional regulator [Lacisediminihabitans sp.]